MSATTLRRLTELEACRYQFGRGQAARTALALAQGARERFTDVPSLIRFHEALLLLRAFPPSWQVLQQSERVLRKVSKRVELLRKAGIDMDDFDPLEVSGIAGNSMQDTLGFELVRWLVRHMPGKVEIAWDNYDDERAMGAVWPRIFPLIDEDASVEADTPWRKWLNAARDKQDELVWFIRRLEELDFSPTDRARIYESLRLPIRWHLGNSRVSRTLNWQPVRQVFYHQQALLTRRDVSLKDELARRPPSLTQLSRKQGESIINLIREVMLVRYRELYGTTFGDPRSVVRADVGRGVSICLWNLPPERRLPLRAYVAGLTLKNGVPINYIEAIGLFEWMEMGFNTFYTFRGGEVAWIFAQVLRCLCKFMGATCISMYPYQLGQNNDEAIESGAFWFYRKLGFRPGRTELVKLVEREEKRIAANPKYQSSPRTLRRLADGHVFYELPGSAAGAWNRFSTRNIGLRVNEKMAREFGGDLRRFQASSAKSLAKILGVSASEKDRVSGVDFQNFAMMLSLIPDLDSWSTLDKSTVLQIIRAKSGRNEMAY